MLVRHGNRAGAVDHEFSAGLDRPPESLADDARGLSVVLRNSVFHDDTRPVGLDLLQKSSAGKGFEIISEIILPGGGTGG